jgi:lipoprotein-anchoring transpeptidase ErfK/SrfK
MRNWQLLTPILIGVAGCSNPSPHVTTKNSDLPQSRSSAQVKFVATERSTETTCPGAAMKVDGTWVCPDEAKAQHLTIIDLGDAWTPKLLEGEGDLRPVFHDQYLALAADRGPDGQPLDDQEELAELYGVVPSLSIVRARLNDDARHACNDAVESAAILALEKPYGQDHGDHIKMKQAARATYERMLEPERKKLNAATISDLANDPKVAATYAKWLPLHAMDAGLRAAQAHMVCEGFMDKQYADGSMTWRTGTAIELYQRRNFLMPSARLDPDTREAMQLDSREQDFRLALRILRERVADASGLIEDGTADGGPTPVLGRMLDPEPMRAARGGEAPLPNGAPDLISPAVESAAKQLGWTSPTEVKQFLARNPKGIRVALALPALPAYYSAHMDLSAEVDRGDVWYDDTPIPRMIRHRPTITVSVNDNGVKRPLIRWPTTIGGWSDVSLPSGQVVQKWKESDVGPRVWRNVYAAPTWLPPAATPDRDLVKNTYGPKGWQVKTSIMGPGPHTAFGLVLMLHENEQQQPDGTMKYWDNGIGTHGSASVTSIVNGNSHGCHRLYNQLAVRLADFLLTHRNHEVKGQVPEYYRRQINYKGHFLAKVDTRGFLYQMTPPVPVNVLKGNIKSARKSPPRNSAAARAD